MRFVNYLHWDVEKGIEAIEEAERKRREKNCCLL